MTSGIEISVITCAHNPRMETLRRVWAALRNQTLANNRWEYILVDNASTTPLADSLKEVQLPAARCVHEEKMGLTHARLRGILESKGEILVFVDDDCLLEKDYLTQILHIFQTNLFLGSIGGYGRAEYETPPPVWMTNSLRQYHLDMSLPDEKNSLIYAKIHQHFGAWFPIGAGMGIRRQLAMAYVEWIRNDAQASSFDRVGTMLSGGGDLDMGICVMEQGFAIGKSSQLRFVHVVPSFRVELSYMLRLLYMSQYSTEQLLIHRGWKIAMPLKKPSLRQQCRKWFGVTKRYSPEDLCWQALARGSADGLSGAPPDPRFCGC